MKKLFAVALVLVSLSAFAQEGQRTFWVKNAGDSTNWVLNQNSNQDTSKAFPLYGWGTWKGFLNDTSGTTNDSIQYKVTLFASSQALTTWDSTVTLAQTVFNSPSEFDGDSTGVTFWGGPTRPKPLFPSAERFGYLVVEVLSTGSQVSSAIVGRMYINFWSNQPGANLSKIGR